MYMYLYIFMHTYIYPHIYTIHTHIRGVYFYIPKTQKKINYASQPKIYYYIKNIHSIRLKPSKISTLAHTKHTGILK